MPTYTAVFAKCYILRQIILKKYNYLFANRINLMPQRYNYFLYHVTFCGKNQTFLNKSCIVATKTSFLQQRKTKKATIW